MENKNLGKREKRHMGDAIICPEKIGKRGDAIVKKVRKIMDGMLAKAEG